MAPKVRGNSLYKIVDGPSWTQAERNSVALGGHLITINNKSEYNWAQENIWFNPNTELTHYFVGLNDAQQEGNYTWASGENSEWSDITDLIFRQGWVAQQQYAAESDYFLVSSNDLGFTDYRSGNPLYTGEYGGLIWCDDNSTYYKSWGNPHYGLAEIPLTSSINFSSTPKEGAGFFTTSINLSAGTQDSGNLAEGATVYWKVTGITADDLESGELSGSGTITNGKFDLQHALKKDSDTGESFEVSLFSDAELTQQIGVTKSEAVSEGAKVVARGNSLYTIVEGPSWTQAEANAVKLGGHLATINNESENIWITDQFNSDGATLTAERGGGGDINLFMGLNDIGNEGVWKWISGEELTYANWYFWSQPSGDTGENYGSIQASSTDGNGFDGYWEDIQNTHPWWSQGIAEIPFIQRGDSAYVIVQGPTWEEAEANAQALGGHLVTINDWDEEDFLLQNTPGGWIGYTDKDVEGDWRWADGTPRGYERWDAGNPSNSWGLEDYAYLDKGAYLGWGAGWNDIPNDYWNHIPQGSNPRMGGIAEINLASFNLPSSEKINFSYTLYEADGQTLASDGLSVASWGSAHDQNRQYVLAFEAESLVGESIKIEDLDITLDFNNSIFEAIAADDIEITSALPLANSALIDNADGFVRIAAGSADALGQSTGTGIGSKSEVVRLLVNVKDSAFIGNGLHTNNLVPLDAGIQVSANLDETVFSDLSTLRDHGGISAYATSSSPLGISRANTELTVTGNENTLHLGTQRSIGGASTTNLIRRGDVVANHQVIWQNTGDAAATGLTIDASGNVNSNVSMVVSANGISSVPDGSVAIGDLNIQRELNGTITDRGQVIVDFSYTATGAAGSVIDLGNAKYTVNANGGYSWESSNTSTKNLITYQGDLNYDGRVSMRDLAYLNAGAAQARGTGTIAHDVDADFNGQIDIADLSVLDADWGQSLHTGADSFLGSNMISIQDLLQQGDASWSDTSFQKQNAVEAEPDFVPTLDDPAITTVLDGDGYSPSTHDIQGAALQDALIPV